MNVSQSVSQVRSGQSSLVGLGMPKTAETASYQTDRSRLRANIRVPDLCNELHLGRLEWVLVGNGNVDFEDTILVDSAGRPEDGSFQMPQIARNDGSRLYSRRFILLDCFQFLYQTSLLVGHGYFGASSVEGTSVCG